MVQTSSTHQFQKSLSTENFQSYGIVREYMNGAVYIECPIEPPKQHDKKCHFKTESVPFIPLKRVSCSCTSVGNCKVHENNRTDKSTAEAKKEEKQDTNKQESIAQDSQSHLNAYSESEFKISIASLDSANYLNSESEKAKEDEFKRWLIRKREEEKRFEENKIYLKAKEEEQKQKRLEQERENFKRWLANKKVQEEKRKAEEAKKLQEERKKKESQKEKRDLESKLRYKLWLKRKEQEDLEKKLKEQMEIMKITEERQRRIEDNEKAFHSWLETSKNKPRPIPSGLGLDSLRSSTSVTYINPVPWNPNTEGEGKPVSH